VDFVRLATQCHASRHELTTAMQHLRILLVLELANSYVKRLTPVGKVSRVLSN